ncbi:MAG: AmmeMemoRadiSam system protein A [Chromatiales bacterium]|nr:AmmeMemoRadiSam system protein A [Chromatiales bacterium]
MVTSAQQQILLQLAEKAIRHALERGQALRINPIEYEEALRIPASCFVTLKRNGELRGCIGSLEAHRSLVEDVAHNADAAAFSDPRFPPLREEELVGLELDISLLTPAEAIHFDSEADLLAQIRPGVDGLIIEEGYRRGTFLPSVWQQLPTPEQFLQHLKLKAGLPPDHWSPNIHISRYTTQIFGTQLKK